MNTSKWLIFIGLKVGEIGGVIFIPYYYAQLFIWVFDMGHESFLLEWIFGIALILASAWIPAAIHILYTVLIPSFIKYNKELTEKIYRRLSR